MQLIRPDDETMILVERDASPFHIGALQFYEVPSARKHRFAIDVRARFAERLPATPLLCRLMEAPLGFDSSVWLRKGSCDLDYHVRQVESTSPMARKDVYEFAERCAMERLDLSRPPFRAFVLDNLEEPDRCALLLKVHHAVADGLGFQRMLSILTDDRADPPPQPSPTSREERPPLAPVWLAKSAWRLWRRRHIRAQQRIERKSAEATLAQMRKDPTQRRPKTPSLKLSAPLTPSRTYHTLTVELSGIRAIGKRLEATVTEVFLTVCAGALRHYLLAIGALPEVSLLANSVRSYRRPEHGEYGNRIVAIHPTIGTDLTDPVARLRVIQRSMALEIEQSKLIERLLDREEVPFGPRKRKRLFDKFKDTTGRPLPGNVTLSSVPGPAEPRYLAGFRQLSNYPLPILEGGRFLNITMRRNCGELDMGIMLCPQEGEHDRRLPEYLLLALAELESAASG